jgi:alkylation response protein AidB-like acyl-CoA dehydrogenase
MNSEKEKTMSQTLEKTLTNHWSLKPQAMQSMEALEKVIASSIAPQAEETDREGVFPRANLEELKQARLLALVTDIDHDGLGHGLREAVAVIERIAQECASTAMITKMHYSAVAVLEQFGNSSLRRSVGKDGALTTLAFSEAGSRSHFWLPTSSAEFQGDEVVLNAQKSWVTTAGEADIYVWSSLPAQAEGMSSIWAVPGSADGLSVPTPYLGMGLRGNQSSPMTAKDVHIPKQNMLGNDGQGFDVMMGTVMPYFSLLNCAVSLGLCEGALARTVSHLTQTRYSYDNSALCDIPQVRGRVARMKLKTDMLRSLLLDSVNAIENAREDATLRVLEAKLAGGEIALAVLDQAMTVCGGAAYRKEVAVERYFRDGRAASVMAPVTDALYDFIGKAVCGMPVFG